MSILLGCLLLVAVPMLTEAAEPLPTMDQVRSAARRWSGSFASLRIETRSLNRGDLLEWHPELASHEDLFEHWYVARDIRWSDEGLLLWEARLIHNDRVVYRWAEGMGAGRTWHANTKRDAPNQERFDHMIVGYPSPIHPLLSYEGIDVIHGMFNSGRWFFEDLESPGFQVVGWEEVEGVRCVHVSLDDGKRRVDYWLDPSAAWIPRRRIGRSQHDALPTGWSEPREWVAVEMQEVAGIAFPRRGRFHASPRHSPCEWQIHQVEWNVPLSRAECLPPRQPGLRVLDYVDTTSYVLNDRGQRPPPRSKVLRYTATPAISSTNDSPAGGVTASPPQSSGALWLWVGGMVCLMTAGGVRFLYHRTATHPRQEIH